MSKKFKPDDVVRFQGFDDGNWNAMGIIHFMIEFHDGTEPRYHVIIPGVFATSKTADQLQHVSREEAFLWRLEH